MGQPSVIFHGDHQSIKQELLLCETQAHVDMGTTAALTKAVDLAHKVCKGDLISLS